MYRLLITTFAHDRIVGIALTSDVVGYETMGEAEIVRSEMNSKTCGWVSYYAHRLYPEPVPESEA